MKKGLILALLFGAFSLNQLEVNATDLQNKNHHRHQKYQKREHLKKIQ
jgi:hypothetical protein